MTDTAIQPKPKQPFITDRKQLSDPKVFETFEKMVRAMIEFDDIAEALTARYLLEEVLVGKYPELKGENPVLYAKYQNMIVLLRWMTLSSREFSEIEDLLKNHLFDAYKAGISVRKKLQDVLDV